MQYSIALLGLAAAAIASPTPQEDTNAVVEDVSPDASAPQGCETSYDGTFQIQVVNVSSTSTTRSLTKRQQTSDEEATLLLTLNDGVLKDDEDRTGYIAANRQFQFDGPPQEGAIYTAGWSVCGNGSLALGDDAVFYQCLSGGFYNLYDQAQAAQCSQVYINVVGEDEAAPVASQAADGQVTETPISSAAPVTQIADGQIQASTSVVAIETSSVRPVSQIPDGQIQATTGVQEVPVLSTSVVTSAATNVVSQIPDGQIQAPVRNTTNATMPVTPFEGAASSNNIVAGSFVAAVVGLVTIFAL